MVPGLHTSDTHEMGSFFTNLQVLTPPDSCSERFVGDVEDALKAHLAANGYDCVPSAKDADRSIIIAPSESEDCPWVSVYDEGSEGQDGKTITGLASGLSQRLSSEVVALLVHDSDVLVMCRYSSGAEAAWYNSAPAYFDAGRDGAQPQFSPSADAWDELLVPTETKKSFKEVLSTPELFVERTLKSASAHLGMDAALATQGYNYLEGSPGRALHFRLRAPSDIHLPPGSPPAFTWAGGSATMPATVGEEVLLNMTGQSAGGASSGIQITIWGDALDRGLVEVGDVVYVCDDGSLQGLDEFGRAFFTPEVERIGDNTVCSAEIAQVQIPLGVDMDAVRALPQAVGHRRSDEVFAARLHYAVKVRARREGSGMIHLGLSPIANAREGQTSHSVELKISSV